MSATARNDCLWAYLMIAPTLIGTLVFFMWPLMQSFYLSFTDWKAFGNYEWSGLENYAKMLQDPDLGLALRNTAIFTVVTVPASLAISTAIALLLNQKIRGLTIYRTLYFLPVITLPAAVAMVWKWLYNSDYGLINQMLYLFGIDGPNWLTDPKLALYSICIVAIWSTIGTNVIIIISGLQGISSTYYEAASIDGAQMFSQFFYITLPLLTPTLFFLSVISMINTLQTFDLIFLMISPRGVTIDATQTIVYLFYQEAFLNNEKGYATAIVMLLFVIVLVVTMIQFRLQKRWVHYE